MATSSDPIESFFAGFESGFVRIPIGLIAILAGEAVCYFSTTESLEVSALLLAVPSLVGMPFAWMTKGALALVGLLALVAMLGSAWAFTQRMAGKVTFYSTFFASAVFCLSLCFTEEGLPRWLAFQCGLFAIYWVVPYLFQRLKRGAE